VIIVLGAVVVPSNMASYSGNRLVQRPPDMQASSLHDTRSPDLQSSPSSASATASGLPTAKNRALLAEAVDSVVNTFAKHARGYGRGGFLIMYNWRLCSFACYTEITIVIRL